MSQTPLEVIDYCAELRETWLREIPVTRAMSVDIESCSEGELIVSAGLEANKNLHGTAFAGSLYSISVLAGWGSAWLMLRQAGEAGHIVVKDAVIKYLRPVTQDIRCRCALDHETREAALEAFRSGGRCRIELACEIQAERRPAVRFTGLYVLSRA